MPSSNVANINDARPDAKARIVRRRAARLWHRVRFIVEAIGWLTVLGLFVGLIQ